MRVPPVRYGGTERIVAALTAELVARGHDVTLFAAGTSQTPARLCATAPRPLWEIENYERLPYELEQIEAVAANAASFDIIHWHTEFLHWLVSAQIGAPSVTTLHGRLDGPSIRDLFAAHPTEPVVSISDAQRRPLDNLALNWIATVHHGLDMAGTYRLGAGEGGYLAFVGRSSAEKGLHQALRVAIRCGLPIRIGARIGSAGEAYHLAHVEPLLGNPLVTWLGEVDEKEKAQLLEGALALLMPIDWNEPFGLAIIESLAAGTPVITRARGALPELMVSGVHGFFAETEDEMVAACEQVVTIDRAACRQWALSRFSTQRMVDDYEKVYAQVIAGRRPAASTLARTDVKVR